MKKNLCFVVLFLCASILQAQNYKNHLLFHLKPVGNLLHDSVSNRVWGPYTNTAQVMNRFGEEKGLFFKGGNNESNRVILSNLKVKSLKGNGLTLVYWSGYERADSAQWMNFFIKYRYPPTSGNPCGRTNSMGKNYRAYFKGSAGSDCNFLLLDSLIPKNRLPAHRWNYHYISLSSRFLHIGLNDTLWRRDSLQLTDELDCPVPMDDPNMRFDSLDEIRLNNVYNDFQFAQFCELPISWVDRFTFYDDVMVFDTAYGPADFDKLRYYPDTALQVMHNKELFSTDYRPLFFYGKESASLFLIEGSVRPDEISRLRIFDLDGRVLCESTSDFEKVPFAVRKSGIYFLRIELVKGVFLNQKIWIE
jgi:hypothetical protein